MRALRFHAARDLRLEEVAPPPGPVGRQVLIAPVVCGICGTDVHEYVEGPLRTTVEAHPLTGGRVPQILGHELSASVVEVGPDVTSVAPGDRISVMPLISCGTCSVCRAGTTSCAIGVPQSACAIRGAGWASWPCSTKPRSSRCPMP